MPVPDARVKLPVMAPVSVSIVVTPSDTLARPAPSKSAGKTAPPEGTSTRQCTLPVELQPQSHVVVVGNAPTSAQVAIVTPSASHVSPAAVHGPLSGGESAGLPSSSGPLDRLPCSKLHDAISAAPPPIMTIATLMKRGAAVDLTIKWSHRTGRTALLVPRMFSLLATRDRDRARYASGTAWDLGPGLPRPT